VAGSTDRPLWAARALVAAAVAAMLVAMFHVAALVVPTMGEPSPPWRHALFVAVNLAAAWAFVRRPRGLRIGFSLLWLQQCISHGAAFVAAHDAGHLDVQSLVVLVAFPCIAAPVYAGRGQRECLGPLAVVSVIAAYLAARTFVFPGVPVLLRGDQGFFWMYADRLLRGERAYRDFFQFTPPGTDVAYLAAFALFGRRVWVANGIVVLLGAALAAIGYRVARGVARPADAALAAASITVLVFGQMLGGTHHWWSVLAIMSSVAVIGADRARPRLGPAGALLGLAAFFTQTHGAAALVAFVGFLVWEGRRRGASILSTAKRCAWLVSLAGATLLALLGYFIAEVGVAPIVSCLVRYVLRTIGCSTLDHDLGLPESLHARSLPWLAPYLIVYAVVLAGSVRALSLVWRGARRSTDSVSAHRMLLSLVALALLAEVALCPSWVRIFAVSMPAWILCVDGVGGSGGKARAVRWASWSATIVVAFALLRSTHRHHAVLVALPGGRIATDAPTRDELLWLAQHVPPGGSLFAANRQSFYLPLGLHDPLFLDGAVPGGAASTENVRRTVDEMERVKLAYVLWSPVEYEAAPSVAREPVATLAAYLHERYRLVASFADGDQAWERK